ncbi:hypothetical protein [Pantoea sp. SOD02]|uniref:hypothetical protein n=1 Tax=Pantoea sp. SOD02 TaxID=2970818 RepID=UPI0021577CF0|nr:hypothetical protein [Pantoea sp. SOD02]UVC28253.1 hypothetical protein NR302_13395 [Pantoea sp. SOD02]
MNDVPYSKDPLDSKVRNYQSIVYTKSSSDNSYAYRIFELSLFYRNKDKIEFVLDLMGVNNLNITPDSDEIELLVQRGNELISDALKHYGQEKCNLDFQKAALLNINNGGGDRKSGLSLKEQYFNQSIKVSQAESSLKEADFNLLCCKGLLGKLRPIVEHMLNKDKVRFSVGILNKIPNERLPSSTYSGENSTRFIYIYKYSWSVITDIVNSIDSIYRVCTPSKDVQVMNSGWKYRYKYCKEFYRKDNFVLRQATTHCEYSDAMAAVELAKENKLSLLSK